MSVKISRRTVAAILVPFALALAAIATVRSEERSLSQPLERPVLVAERLVSHEEDNAVPPEPQPPTAAESYHGLDAHTPATVAEEILRLRDALGNSPLSGRAGFQPLPLANVDDDASDTPAPWPIEDERRLLRERLQGMASRPILSPPSYAPYAPATPHWQPEIEAAVLPPGAPAPTFVAVPAPNVPVLNPLAAAPALSHIQSLRMSAQQLDQVAHVLECHDLFDRADQVRRLADLMRQDARQRRAEQTPPRRAVQPAADVRAPECERECERKSERE